MMEDENTDIVYNKAPRGSLVAQNGTYFNTDWFGGMAFNSFYKTGKSVKSVYTTYKQFKEENWPRN